MGSLLESKYPRHRGIHTGGGLLASQHSSHRSNHRGGSTIYVSQYLSHRGTHKGVCSKTPASCPQGHSYKGSLLYTQPPSHRGDHTCRGGSFADTAFQQPGLLILTWGHDPNSSISTLCLSYRAGSYSVSTLICDTL